ncbi:MAG: GNAT family N-acetyltransferase [Candidatus Cryptobacteroides sp.]
MSDFENRTEETGLPSRPSKVEIRCAFPEDAPFIAKSVLAAMGYEEGGMIELGSNKDAASGTPDDTPDTTKDDAHLPQIRSYEQVRKALEEIAARPDTLYSYRNVHIATYGGEVAGAMAGYDGAGYREMATLTFGLIAEKLGVEPFNPGEETRDGEYYLDSLYVDNIFCGHSIGAILLRNELEVAEGLGFRKVTLIVDKEKPWLHRLYARLGFREDGEVLFFGENYLRMIQEI